MPTDHSTQTSDSSAFQRVPVSVRTRFEVFKRDGFTCQYCGRKSPDVVLEVDHVQPVALGGSNDVINLITACWDCNHGKSDKPLSELLTGEDPHDRAVMLLERERQLKEYNAVVSAERERRDEDAWELVRYWRQTQGYDKDELDKVRQADWNWLFSALQWCPKEVVKNYMDVAINRDMTKSMKYVAGCCNNWRSSQIAEPANA